MSSASLATTPSQAQSQSKAKPVWPVVKSIGRKAKSVCRKALSWVAKVVLIPFRWLYAIPKALRHIIVSTIITILALVLSAVFAKVFVIGSVNFDLGNEVVNNRPTNVIVLVPDFTALDASARTSVIDWIVGDYGDCVNLTELTNQNVNIYFDQNLLLPPSANNADKTVPSLDPPSTPVFRYNSTTECNVTDSSVPSFRTVNKLIVNLFTNKSTQSSLQFYPFDKYSLVFSMFARNAATNASVGIDIRHSVSGLSNFNIKLKDKQELETADEPNQYLFEVYRSRSVQVLVVIIIFANWLVTIAFMWITIASIMWPEKIVKDLFVIPIASLFAFTAVRANMPGAPAGFGAIVDYFGILPNLAIMTLCSAILLGIVLFRRTHSFPDGVRAKGSRVDNAQGLADALGAAEKAIAAANEALAVVKGGLVAADPPTTADVKEKPDINKTTTSVDEALDVANPPPAATTTTTMATTTTRTNTNEAQPAENPAFVTPAVVPAGGM